MLDNQLIKIFLPIIKTGLINSGLGDVTVRQSYQPTQQGADSGRNIYFFKIGDYRYGFLSRTNTWDIINNKEIHTETQQYETTYQVNAWAIQDPTNTDSITASDLVNTVSAILQSDYCITTLQQNGIGILRVTNVRNPYFLDDYDKHEASPSFDFTLTHEQVIISEVDINQSYEIKIYKV